MAVESIPSVQVAPFRASEVRNAKTLAAALIRPGDAVTEVAQLCISGSTMDLLRRYEEGEAAEETVREVFVAELNELVDGELLYRHPRLEDHEPPVEIRSLIAGGHVDEESRRRLNIDFLERAFTGHLHVQPYRGAHPFQQADAFRFFGRRREGSEVVARLMGHETVLLYAPSGAGKTSLLNATIVPQLVEKDCEVLPPMRVQGVLPPNVSPRQIRNPYVYHALSNCWELDRHAQETISQEELPGMTLAEFVRRRRESDSDEAEPRPLVAVFDQFEELFVSYPEYWRLRRGVFQQMCEALAEDEQLRILLVMREDFIAELDPYASMFRSNLRMRLRLERLREDAALEAIVRPLDRTKRRFAEGVAERLVDKLMNVPSRGGDGEPVKTEFVEPVQLQVVCCKLWDELEPDALTITERHLERLADVAAALRDFVDRTVDSIVKDYGVKEGAVRTWFEKHLITPAGTRGVVLEGDETTGGLPNAAVRRLDKLHILHGEMRDRRRWYELSHDRFVTAIQDSNHAFRRRIGAGIEQQYRPLLDRAARWDRAARPAGDWLDAEELIKAERYLAVLDSVGLEPDETFVAFVEESREAERRRKLEEAQAKVRLQRRLIRGTVGGLFIVAALLVVVAFLWKKADDAKEEERRAKREEQSAKEKAQHAEQDARHALARRLISAGMDRVAVDDLSAAQLHFLQAYHTEPDPSIGDKVRVKFGWSGLAKPIEMIRDEGLDSCRISADGNYALLISNKNEDEDKEHQNEVTVRDLAKHTSEDWHPQYNDDKLRVRSVAWQSQDNRFVTLSDTEGGGEKSERRRLQVWDAAKCKSLTPPLETQAGVKHYELSSDGSWLVAGVDADSEDADPGVYVWKVGQEGKDASTRDGKSPVRELAEPNFELPVKELTDLSVLRVWSAKQRQNTMQPEGPVVFVAGKGNTASVEGRAWIWRPNQDKRIELTFNIESDSDSSDSDPIIKHATFSPDGRSVAAACSDGVVRLWIVEKIGELSHPWSLQPIVGSADKIVFSRDGKRVAVATDEGALVWDLDSLKPETDQKPMGATDEGAPVRNLPTPKHAEVAHGARVFDIALSPSGRFLATAGRDRTIRVWRPNFQLPSQQVGSSLFHVGSVNRVRFLPPEPFRLFTATDVSGRGDGYGVVWKLDSKAFCPTQTEIEGRLSFSGIRLNAPARRIVSVVTGSPGRTENDITSSVDRVSLHREDEFSDAASDDASVTYAALSRSAKHIISIISTDQAGYAVIRDAATKKQVARLPHDNTPELLAACVSQKHRAMTVTDRNDELPRRVHFWNWQQSDDPKSDSPKHVEDFSLEGEGVEYAAFSEDGELAVVTTTVVESGAGRAHVFRLQRSRREGPAFTATKLGVIKHEQTVTYADFNHDNSLIVTTSVYDVAKISAINGNTIEKKKQKKLQHTADVTFAVFFQLDGDRTEYVVTCADDNTAHVWNATSGDAETHELRHGDYVRHAAVRSDGLLVTASLDHNAYLWEAKTGEFVAALKHDTPVHVVAFGPNNTEITTVSSSDRNFGDPLLTTTGGRDVQTGAVVHTWSWEAESPLGDQDGTLLEYLEFLAGRKVRSDKGLSRMDLEKLRSRWDDVASAGRKQHFGDGLEKERIDPCAPSGESVAQDGDWVVSISKQLKELEKNQQAVTADADVDTKTKDREELVNLLERYKEKVKYLDRQLEMQRKKSQKIQLDMRHAAPKKFFVPGK